MPNRVLAVLVSRPTVVPTQPNHELRRPDFCWTKEGELLVPPGLTCADVEVCGCSWSFCGVTSAQATTWGVVERRRRSEVRDQLRTGRHVVGNSEVEGFADLLFAEIVQMGVMVARLRPGSVVGIWTLDDGRYSLFDRTPLERHASARNAAKHPPASHGRAARR